MFCSFQAKNGLLVEEDTKLVAKLLKTQVMALIRDRDERRKAQMLTSEYPHDHPQNPKDMLSENTSSSTNTDVVDVPNLSSSVQQQISTTRNGESNQNASSVNSYRHDSSSSTGQQK